MAAIAFDVFGTLVDPLQINKVAASLLGERITEFAALWRQKQIEYAFRRGLMQNYVDFTVCSRQALEFCAQQYKLQLSPEERETLFQTQLTLPPYPDVPASLDEAGRLSHEIYAFSNGPKWFVQRVLESSRLDHFFRGIISVDDIRTYKPNPAVYAYLGECLRKPCHSIWLVSGNAWDVIGAKSAGLRAAWIKRSPEQIFDPWEFKPDLIVSDLKGLVDQIPGTDLE
jgi:2-haloacid dehalogenase